MYIAVLADNIADRKQMERLLNRASEHLREQTGTIYTDVFGDSFALLRSPMKYDLFFLGLCASEETLEVADHLIQMHVPGKIAICKHDQEPFSYTNAIKGLLTIEKPILVKPLHKLILDVHEEKKQSQVPMVELRAEQETRYVPVSDIVYAQCVRHLTFVHLKNGDVLQMLGNMDDFLRNVGDYEEFEIKMKGYIFNTTHILRETRNSILLSTQEKIAVPLFAKLPFLI